MLVPRTGNAQTTDFRARLSGKISTDIGKVLKADLEYEHRFDYNLTHFDKAIIEPSLSLSLSKAVDIGVSYRAMYDQNSKRQNEIKQRSTVFARYGTKLNDLKFKLKTALQYGFDDLTNTSVFDSRNLISRTAFEIEYNWFGSRFTPFAGYEFFVHLNHPNGAIANQWRLKAGTDYKIARNLTCNVYYLFENEFNVVAPTDAHVLGAGFAYKF